MGHLWIIFLIFLTCALFGAISGYLWPSWGQLGNILGYVGPYRGQCEDILGQLGVVAFLVVGLQRAVRERSERTSTHTMDMLGHLGAIFLTRALPVSMLGQVF